MTSIKPNLWLAEQLGKPAYRVVGSSLDLASADLPQEEAFVEARVEASDSEGLAYLQNNGFSIIDCNLTLERAVEEVPPQAEVVNLPTNVRFASAEDEPGVRRLASDALKHNRFHRDPCISGDVAAQIKEAWAGNYFSGRRGDWMVVAEGANGISGFLQLLCAEDGVVVIDLIAVVAHCRRQGLAQSMTAYAYQNCMGHPVNMRVGTQLGNAASLRLYQAMGFRLVHAAYLLHRHT